MAKDLKSPSGMKVVASTNQQAPMPKSTGEIYLKSKSFYLFTKIHDCGHRGAKSCTISLFGMDLKFSTKKFCPDCLVGFLERSVIRCSVCGFGILPGDPVSLYSLAEGESFFSDIPVRRAEDGSAIGCLRMDCCPSGAFFAGYWTEEGFKAAFEGRTAAEECLSTGKAVSGNL